LSAILFSLRVSTRRKTSHDNTEETQNDEKTNQNELAQQHSVPVEALPIHD
jgi:hypothetical protein